MTPDKPFERRSLQASELSDETIAKIAASKVPEEFNHLDDLDKEAPMPHAWENPSDGTITSYEISVEQYEEYQRLLAENGVKMEREIIECGGSVPDQGSDSGSPLGDIRGFTARINTTPSSEMKNQLYSDGNPSREWVELSQSRLLNAKEWLDTMFKFTGVVYSQFELEKFTELLGQREEAIRKAEREKAEHEPGNPFNAIGYALCCGEINFLVEWSNGNYEQHYLDWLEMSKALTNYDSGSE